MNLVFATNNQNKIDEIQAILGGIYTIKGLGDIGFFEEIPEDQDTLEGNASQKSHFIYSKYKVNCFADDTGLEVIALNNLPGVHSARYAGSQKKSADNIAKLLNELRDKNNRKAQFRTIISLILDGKEFLFQGVVKGRIINEERGVSGFGYDPVFIPDGYNETFAEMEISEKNKISHRAIATKKLIQFLQNNF